MGEWLDGPRAKLRRAQHQIDDLGKEFKAFTGGDRYAIRGERYEETRESAVYIDGLRDEIDPLWAVRVGEVIHDLRSSLDHIVCALIEHDGGRVTRDSGMPVCWKPASFNSEAPKKLAGITSYMAIAAIKADQPFSRPQPSHSTLYVLNELWNCDKHRAVHICKTVASTHEPIEVTRDPGVSFEMLRVAPPGTELKDGTEIARWREAVGSKGNVKVDAKVAIDIGFGETRPRQASGAGVHHVLSQSAIYVGNVIQNFEQFFE